MAIGNATRSDWAALTELYRGNHPDAKADFQPPTAAAAQVFVERDKAHGSRITGFVHVSHIESDSGRRGMLHEVEIAQGTQLSIVRNAEVRGIMTDLIRRSLVEAALKWLTDSCGCTTADVSSLGAEGSSIIRGLGLELDDSGAATLTYPGVPIYAAPRVWA